MLKWIAGFVFLTGCATAFNSPENYIAIQSEADLSGASVWVNGKPATVDSMLIESKPDGAFGMYRVSSNTDPYTMGPGLSLVAIERCIFCRQPEIVIKKEGLKDTRIALERRISPIFYANFLNIFGFIIDLYSGFMWKYEPSTITIHPEREP